VSARLRSSSLCGRAGRGSSRAALRPALAVAAGLVLGFAGGDARADDQAVAEALFDRGHKLMGSNATLDEACRTLEQSLKLMDRGDTALNLAECHRRQGKTATAWAEFDHAITHGYKVGFAEAIQTATRLRDELAGQLSKLTVTVSPETATLPGLTVEVLGRPWPRERWNAGHVIDPGPVRVRAQATGYKPFEVQVNVGPDRDTQSVVVVLEVEPPPPPALPPPPPPPRLVKPSRPLWPWLVGAAGVALGAAAVGSEIVSVRAGHELDDKCGPSRQSCPPPSTYDYSSARGRELTGYGLFVGLGAAGLVALGAAGVGLALPVRAAPSASFVVSPTTVAGRWAF
jgi:hypothetical protein